MKMRADIEKAKASKGRQVLIPKGICFLDAARFKANCFCVVFTLGRCACPFPLSSIFFAGFAESAALGSHSVVVGTGRPTQNGWAQSAAQSGA